MDRQYQIPNDGQEASLEDLELLGEVSALAGDRVLADLIQIPASEGAVGPAVVPQKAVMPFGTRFGPTGPFKAVVEPTGSGDGSVRVYPFRAVIGGRGDVAADADTRILDIRTAYHNPPTGVEFTTVALEATSANHRVDLIYALVQLASPATTTTRFVKAAVGGAVSPQVVSQFVRTTVTLVVVKGTEGASPTRPALPADVDGVAYNIPIAYVWLGHPFTTGSTIEERRIEEVAPVLGQNAGRVGGANAGPVGEAFRAGAGLKDQDVWSVNKRPDVYLPPSMSGLVVRWFGLDQKTDLTIPTSGTRTLDSTIDWRQRAFKTRAQARGAANASLAWQSGTAAAPADTLPAEEQGGTVSSYETFGQSFQNDESSPGSYVCRCSNGNLGPAVAAGATLDVWVDLTSGQLKITANGTAAGCHIFFWIEATGQFKTGGDPTY